MVVLRGTGVTDDNRVKPQIQSNYCFVFRRMHALSLVPFYTTKMLFYNRHTPQYVIKKQQCTSAYNKFILIQLKK